MTAPDWDLYRAFLSVLKRGSLSAAAQELALTQPTVGRQIAALEAALGTPLFLRSQGGVTPTDAARALEPHAEAMAAAAAALVRSVSGAAGEPAGTVRLTASEFIGVEVLPAILTAFREANPGIVIELVLSNENQDLSRRDADIAVRMARPTQAALVAKRLGDVSIGLYAHRDYAARHGLPASLDTLSRHPIIGFDADPVALRSSRSGGLPVSRETFALRSDSEHARMAALRSGFGIGACQREVARREPGLIAVLPQEIRFTLEMWLVMHEDLRGLRRVRLLYDHLATALGAYARSALVEPRPKKRGKTGIGKPRPKG